MYRNVEIILYDENILYDKLQILNRYKNIQWAYIMHDKDNVKEHYHLRIFCEDKKSISAWSKLLKVEKHDIETLTYKKLSIRYLVHLDNPEKYQYSFDNIVSNFEVKPYLTNKSSEIDDISTILNLIDNSGYLTLYFITNFCVSHNLWSSYRRNYSIIREYLIEHNKQFY